MGNEPERMQRLAKMLVCHTMWPAHLRRGCQDAGRTMWASIHWHRVDGMWVPDLFADITGATLFRLVPPLRSAREIRLGHWIVLGGELGAPPTGTTGVGPTIGAACADLLLARWGVHAR